MVEIPASKGRRRTQARFVAKPRLVSRAQATARQNGILFLARASLATSRRRRDHSSAAQGRQSPPRAGGAVREQVGRLVSLTHELAGATRSRAAGPSEGRGHGGSLPSEAS